MARVSKRGGHIIGAEGGTSRAGRACRGAGSGLAAGSGGHAGRSPSIMMVVCEGRGAIAANPVFPLAATRFARHPLVSLNFRHFASRKLGYVQ